MAAEYDFIVVGAGPSGCVVASRLARATGAPSVLLLEAGGSNESLEHMAGEDRFKVAFQANSPLNWGFKTVPQTLLKGQEVDYSRGKGLGGSTAINFCGWVVGSSADYDEWSRMVGDDDFAWTNAKKCLKKVENAHLDVPSGFEGYIKPKIEDHGTNGAVDISYDNTWVRSVHDVFTAAEQVGFGVNPDVNSGDPIGMGIGSVCIYKNSRVTSASAYISSAPPNLTVVPDAQVAKVLLDGQAAKGVETVDGRKFFATKEVIVSGGSLSTPQILLLSGIGPASELDKHGITVLHDLPQVGQNLQDHCFSGAGIVVRKEPTESYSQKPTPMGWFKTPATLESAEFKELPESWQTFLKLPRVPNWELATHTPPRFGSADLKFESDEQYLGAMALIMNPLSKGSVTLKSNNPLDAPLIDPRFLTHPFDRRNLIEGVRQMMKFFTAPIFKAMTVRKALWPKDDSDEAIWDHIRTYIGSSWHMCGTARMGRSPENSCVDSNFKIHGLQHLRVVDLSVCPLAPNNHTQTTAYIVGEIAAEKLIAEYRLG